MAFDIGSVVAHIKADTSQFQQGIKSAKDGIDDVKKGTIDLGAGLKNLAIITAAAGAAIGYGLGTFLKGTAEEAREFNRQMVTLGIISERFGVSAQSAQDAAKNLGKELMIGTGSAAEALQNLLKSGLGIDKASELLKRFTNEAITGKSPTLSLSQAVQNLSFAYATENSALGNLSGISENFSDIVEKGRQSLIGKGVAVSSITNEMAKYEGMINLTNLTLGAAEKLQTDGTKANNEAGQAWRDFRIEIGQAVLPILDQFAVLARDVFIPALKEILPVVTGIIDAVRNNFPAIAQTVGETFASVKLWIDETLMPAILELVANWNKNFSWVSASTILIFNTIKGSIQVAMALIYGIVTVILELISGDWSGAWDAVNKTTGMAFEGLKTIFNGIVGFVSSWGSVIYQKLKEPFENAWNTISDLMNKIKDAIDFTKRHSPSVVDIVENGVSKVNRAFNDLMFTSVMPDAPAVASSITPNIAGTSQITIDLSGAMIADEQSAQRIGELVGDNIIKRLQANVRI